MLLEVVGDFRDFFVIITLGLEFYRGWSPLSINSIKQKSSFIQIIPFKLVSEFPISGALFLHFFSTVLATTLFRVAWSALISFDYWGYLKCSRLVVLSPPVIVAATRDVSCRHHCCCHHYCHHHWSFLSYCFVLLRELSGHRSFLSALEGRLRNPYYSCLHYVLKLNV